jgi:SAM-dependent methyltransferase
MSLIESRFSNLDGGRLLDVATGRGAFLEFLLKKLKSFDRATGIDSSEQNISIARYNLGDEKVAFEVMDARQMSFENASFDMVTISNALHHLEIVEPVLSEMIRVLRPGGTLIVNEMFRDYQDERQSVYVEAHNWWAAIDRTLGVVHNPTYLRDELIGFVEDLNLAEVDTIESRDELLDPNDALEASWLVDKIDEYVRKIEKDSEHFDLLKQGRRIRDDVLNIGFSKPTELMIFGKL